MQYTNKAQVMYSYKRLKIFVVDEDPIIRELYKQYLYNIGFTYVDVFENGWQGFEQLHKKPDIIFLDYDVPPMDGIDILKKIKRIHPSIYLVFTTSNDNRQLIDHALKSGAFDFIIKGDLDEHTLPQVVKKITAAINSVQRNTDQFMKILNFF